MKAIARICWTGFVGGVAASALVVAPSCVCAAGGSGGGTAPAAANAATPSAGTRPGFAPQLGPAVNVGPAQVHVGGATGVGGSNFTPGTLPNTLPALGQSGSGIGFGNAPVGSPPGNQQAATKGTRVHGAFRSPGTMSPGIGGVNDNGAVVGGFQNNAFRGFQNGAFAIGGFNGGGMGGPTAAVRASGNGTVSGPAGPNYFPNNNVNPSGIPGNNNAPASNASTRNANGASNPAPMVGQETAVGGHFQYGWW